MANENYIVLTREAFDGFEENPKNSEALEAGNFGIHEKVGEDWVTKTIKEAEFGNYKFIIELTDFVESETFAKLNENTHGYPCVEAI
jgi:hypothetical protein